MSSRLTGGSFANGALSAAFVHMFNAEGGSLKVLFARGSYMGISVRDHAALYVSYENEAGFEEFLFDPDGGYTPKGGVREQQYAKGDFDLNDYLHYHESMDGAEATEIINYSISVNQAKQIVKAIDNYPLADSFTCATSVGTVLKNLQRFDYLPQYSGITLPGTLYNDLSLR